MIYLRALISATTQAEAIKIIASLATQKLIAGAMITSGQSVYWWEKKLVKRKYWNISAFTHKKHSQSIIREVRKLHADDVPIVSFSKIEAGNADFLKWILESTKR